MQPLYLEAIQEDTDTRITSRLRNKWLGSRLAEFARRPAVANTLVAAAAVVGGWALYESLTSAYDIFQTYQDVSTNQDMLNHLQEMSGSEAYNLMQSGTDVDHSQYAQ
jgi:hypothetical protein